jgi:monomeric sarcosine oxidase
MSAGRAVSEPVGTARDRSDRAFDCVVVGAGVNGLAAARAVARTGAHTALLEQFSLHHAHGSSHGDSRSIRHYPAPEWMALWREAEPLWKELEEEAGVELLRRVGVFTHAGELRSELESLVRLGVPAEAIDAGEALRRFGIRMPPTGESYLDPTSGYILAARACEALAASCVSHGVTIIEGAAVIGLQQSTQEVTVSTAGHGTFTAEVAVVTAGSWARELLAPLGIALPVYVSLETVAYFGTAGQAPLPVMIDYATADEVTGLGIYALPSPTLGLKVAAHHSGVRSEEVPQSRGPDARVVERLTRWVSEHLPQLDATPTATETCLYTVAADEELLLFRDGRVVVGAACSGHAFKFATATGQRLASLATAGDRAPARAQPPGAADGLA